MTDRSVIDDTIELSIANAEKWLKLQESLSSKTKQYKQIDDWTTMDPPARELVDAMKTYFLDLIDLRCDFSRPSEDGRRRGCYAPSASTILTWKEVEAWAESHGETLTKLQRDDIQAIFEFAASGKPAQPTAFIVQPIETGDTFVSFSADLETLLIRPETLKELGQSDLIWQMGDPMIRPAKRLVPRNSSPSAQTDSTFLPTSSLLWTIREGLSNKDHGDFYQSNGMELLDEADRLHANSDV